MPGRGAVAASGPNAESQRRAGEWARWAWTRDGVWLAGAVVLAAGLRVAALAVLHGPDLVNASESGLTAANWVAGHGYTFDFYGYRAAHPLQSFMPPLFTAVVAACLLAPWPEAAFGTVQVALGSLTVLLVARIGESLAGRRVGLAAAALTAAYPPFLVLADQPTQPVLNTFLLALWLWATVRVAQGGGRRWTAAVGLVVGLNVLSRPSAIVLLPVTALGVWLWPGGSARRALRAWRAIVPAAGVAGLVVAPWIARGWAVHGRPIWISTNGGFSFWNGNNSFTTGSAFDVRVADLAAYSGDASDAAPGAAIVQVKPYPLPLALRPAAATMDEVALDRALYRAGLDYIQSHPGQWAGLLGRKLAGLWWFRPNIGRSSGFYQDVWILPYEILYVVVLALAVVGAILSARRWRRCAAVYGVFASMTVVYVAYNTITRYRWEMEPLLLVLAAVPVVALWERRPGLRAR